MNVISDSNDENNFSHKLVITEKQVLKSLKTQLSRVVHLKGFFGRHLKPLLKTCFPLMKNVLKP